jgi:ribonuclease HI
MYFNGSLMKTGAGTSLIFVSPIGFHMRYVIRLHFAASNNIAEYEGLINGLHIAIELGIKCLDVRGDSQRIVDQVIKESSCHDLKMEAYCKAVRCLEERFDGLELNHIMHKHNEAMDELAKIVSLPATSTSPPSTIGIQGKKATSRPSLHLDWILPKDLTPPRRSSPRSWK